MRYEFHPEARQEFRKSTGYYENEVANLGVTFAAEIESTLNRILESPDRWPFIEQDVRTCLAHRFPFGVLYTVESDYILIVAVMHFSRKPGYWRDRLPDRPN